LLRDQTGVVWYVRNGEILRVANRSQGWTLAIVDIPIGYDENIDRVRDIVDSVANDMDEDPTYDDMLAAHSHAAASLAPRATAGQFPAAFPRQAAVLPAVPDAVPLPGSA